MNGRETVSSTGPGAPAAALRFCTCASYRFVDWATQGFVVLVGLIILIGHNARLPFWPWLLAAHAATFLLIHTLIVLAARYPRSRLLDLLRNYYPILLYTGFYRETGTLNQMLYTGYLDAHFLRLEKALFGWQPGLELVERFPSRWIAEVLYASYFSYYLMIAGVGLTLLIRDRRQFAHFVSVVSFVFYCCYLTYIFVPVVGPRIVHSITVEPPLPPDVIPTEPIVTPATVQAGFFFQIMAWIYERFETAGAAFPSSHVAVALTTLYFSFLYLRRIRWIHLVAAVLLCVSTVYGRYHYVVDVAAGAVTALALVPLANKLYRRFQGAPQPPDSPGP